MVAQVHRLQEQRAHRHEEADLGPRATERPPPTAAEREAPVAVAQEADLDAPLRGLNELVAKPGARLVVADEVILRVYVVAGFVDRRSERVVHDLPLVQHVDAVAVRRRPLAELRTRGGRFAFRAR